MTDTKQTTKFKYKIEDLDNSQVKIIVTIAKDDFNSKWNKALKKGLELAEVEGFRKGHVPEKVFMEKYGEFAVLQEMAYTTIDETYVEVLIESKVKMIGQPKVDISKLAKGDDFEYFIIVDVLPEFKMGNYKKLKDIKLKEAEVATESEVENTIEELRKMRKDKDGNLPEVNAEFLKAVGNFNTIDELRKQIIENLNSEKKFKAEDSRRVEIIEKLISESEGEIPESLISNELQKIEDRMNADLSQMGTNLDGYLKMMKKNKDEWLIQNREVAIKNAKLQILLLQISKEEKIELEPLVLEEEIKHMLLHYPNVDKDRLKAYCEERMINSLVMEFIQSGKLPNQKEFFKVDHEH